MASGPGDSAIGGSAAASTTLHGRKHRPDNGRARHTAWRWALVSLALPGVFLGKNVSAHHSFGIYDLETTIVMEGTVERYDWRNPHVRIAVRDADGVIWDIETDSPATMEESGWTRDSYAPGDAVTVRFHPSRTSGRAAGLLYTVRGPNFVSRGSVAHTGMPTTLVAGIVLSLSLLVAFGVAATQRWHRNVGAIVTSMLGAAVLLWTLRFSFSVIGEVIGLGWVLLGAIWAARSAPRETQKPSRKPV